MNALADKHRNENAAIGYVYGRVDAGDERIPADDAAKFAAFFVANDGTWGRFPHLFARYLLAVESGEDTPQ